MKLYLLKSITTNNFNDREMAQKIGTLWQEAVALIGTQALVTYGVYYNYAGNYRDDYQLSIGTEELATMEWLEVAAETTYQVFDVEPSEENAVYQTWQKIWQLEEQGRLNRAYSFDYEKYEVDGSVSIYIAIK